MNNKHFLFINFGVLFAWLLISIARITSLRTIVFESFFSFLIFFSCIFLFHLFFYNTHYKFIPYAFIFMVVGLMQIFYKSTLLGVVTIFISIIMVWRQQLSIAKHIWIARIFTFVIILIPFIEIFVISDNRQEFVSTIIEVITLTLSVIFVVFLLYPLYNKQQKTSVPELDLTKTELSERQTTILVKVLEGIKYTAIAQELDCSHSTISKEMKNICQILNVCDRTELLIRYKKYRIKL